jgi:hypothetical protein
VWRVDVFFLIRNVYQFFQQTTLSLNTHKKPRSFLFSPLFFATLFCDQPRGEKHPLANNQKTPSGFA